jgi:hypothetical protein
MRKPNFLRANETPGAQTIRLARKPSGWRANRPAGAETVALAQKPAGWRRNRRDHENIPSQPPGSLDLAADILGVPFSQLTRYRPTFALRSALRAD